MKIGFDVSELAAESPGGVRTAITLLLEALARYEPDLHVVALAPREVAVPRGVRFVATGGPTKPRRWRDSSELREAVAPLSLFHSPLLAHPEWDGPPITATVHELPFVVSHRLEGFAAAVRQERWLARAMAHCRALVVPSEVTRRQVCAVHPGADRILHVIPHPAPHVDEMQHDHESYLLYLGRLDRRKAVDSLLEACARMEDGKLVLAGPHDPERKRKLEERVAQLGIEDRVQFAGQVDDSMRQYLYRRAGAVALVSRSEGFGFPVLEALGRGVPVLVGRGTGAEETGGDVVLPVDPDDPDGIVEAWTRTRETEYRARVRTHGPARLLQFGPERTAHAYAKMWRDAAAG
ncbi:MAG: glycosyltransferase [Planctomycetota bacterium]